LLKLLGFPRDHERLELDRCFGQLAALTYYWPEARCFLHDSPAMF
jgi:hypothetical protein